MGGFFGMLKENKYIQKGWEFNPREELRKKQTNSCDSRSPWRAGLLSDTRSITRLSRLFAGLFCGAARAEPGWAESKNSLIQAGLPRQEGKSQSSDKSHLRQQLPQGSAFAPARSQGGFSCLSVLSPWTVFLSGLSKTPPATPGNSSKSLHGPLASKTLWHPLAF